MVKHRLEYYCESKKVFPASQAGFRRGRGVTKSSGKAGRTRREGVREEEGPLVLFFRRFSNLRLGLARQASAETPENRHFW